jgi:hypothetical protein
MNDFFYVLVGIVMLMAQCCFTVLVVLGILPPQIFILASTMTGCIAGIIIAAIGFLASGILAPVVSCRISGKTLIQILTAGKKIKFEVGKEQSGICDTDSGCFVTPIDTIYSMPNGVRSGFAHHKYGVTLKPSMVKTCSILKENNINDILELENTAKTIKENGGELTMDLTTSTGVIPNDER